MSQQNGSQKKRKVTKHVNSEEEEEGKVKEPPFTPEALIKLSELYEAEIAILNTRGWCKEVQDARTGVWAKIAKQINK